jgi:hypothetical protein
MVWCGSPLQIVMAVWHTFFLNSHYSLQWAPSPDPASSNLKKAPTGHFYLQWAVIPDWVGSKAF